MKLIYKNVDKDGGGYVYQVFGSFCSLRLMFLEIL